MSNQSGIISAPVSINDLQTVLGTSQNGDLGSLILNGNINKWSKKKPVIHSNLFASNPSDKGGDSVWYKTGTFGLDIQKVSSIVTLINDQSTLSQYTYNRPTGGVNAPFRLLDFNGYYHLAEHPVYAFDSQDSGYTTGTNPQIATLIALRLVSDYNFSILDLTDYKDYYFGSVLYRSSTQYRWITSENTISYEDLASAQILIPTTNLAIGTWYIFPFLSSIKRTDYLAAEQAAEFLPLPVERRAITLYTSAYTILVMASYASPTDDTIIGSVRITNRASSIYTFVNCYLALTFMDNTSGSQIVGEQTISVGYPTSGSGTIVVPANSTIDVQFTFSNSYREGRTQLLTFTSTSFGGIKIIGQIAEFD